MSKHWGCVLAHVVIVSVVAGCGMPEERVLPTKTEILREYELQEGVECLRMDIHAETIAEMRAKATEEDKRRAEAVARMQRQASEFDEAPVFRPGEK